MTLPPLSRICFHRDYDGVVGAAMVLASAPGEVGALSPVQYRPGLHWTAQDIGAATAVVDFLYHPQAAVWVDHHDTTFGNPSDRAAFRPSPFLAFDASAPSCPAVIVRLPWFEMSRRWEGFLQWANTIDSAAYPSAKDANDLENPHILLSAVIGEARDDALLARIVRSVADREVEEVLSERGVAPIRDRVLRDEQRIRSELRSRLRVTEGVAVLDQSDLAIPYRRYLAFEAHPAVRYGIGLYMSGHDTIVSVGENPWGPRGPVNLGRVCQEFGGGGRHSTAGIPAPSRGVARELADTLAVRLNGALRETGRQAAAG